MGYRTNMICVVFQVKIAEQKIYIKCFKPQLLLQVYSESLCLRDIELLCYRNVGGAILLKKVLVNFHKKTL